MRILIALLIGLTSLIGPAFFWLKHRHTIQNSTPIIITTETENLREHIGKIVAIQNACLPDFTLQVTEGELVKREVIPILSCDSLNQSYVRLFLKIEPHLFSSVDNIYKKGEDSQYGLLVGKLEKSLADITSSSGRIIRQAGYEFNADSSLQLNSHFNPWEQYVEMWLFLFLLPVGAIILCVKYIQNKKTTSNND